MADQILFDKLRFIDRLTHAGVAEDQARAHAEALEESLRDAVATKNDIAALRTDMAGEMAALRTDMVGEMAALRTEITAVNHRIDVATRDLTIRMGVIATALFAALTAIKFFA